MGTGNPNEPEQAITEIGKLSGPQRQLSPEEQQVVDGEPQTITTAPMPLIPVAEPEKREKPRAAGAPYPVTYPLPGVEGVAGAPAIPFTYPILRMNRYSGSDGTWQELVKWDVDDGWVGDLHEISLLSSNDAKTKYRIILANVDQNVPTDRPTTTPLTLPWRNVRIPPGFTVRIDVASIDGTAIVVDGMITGSVTPIS